MDSSGRLLVVDDDPSVRAMLVEYLSGHRYDVRAADGGAAMRAEIERDLPDLVLLDIRMPGEDGLTLARFLREHYDVGIIMVTASGDVVDRVVGLEIGADDYVAKPFDPRELLARVKSVLRRMQAREGEGSSDADERTAVCAPKWPLSLRKSASMKDVKNSGRYNACRSSRSCSYAGSESTSW